MGWLWSSSSSSPTPIETSNASRPSAPAEKQSTPPTTAPNEPPVDPEIEKFFDLFQNDKNAKIESSQPQQPPTDDSKPSWLSSLRPSLSSSSSSSSHIEPAPLGDALSESLLPTDMSCRQAFDQAWACNSMGGQWNAVYRYGAMRSCSDQWDDFWFCMRTKSYSGEMREKMIRAHYRNREYAKYGPGKPSSEDIWESRSEKVEPGTVMADKID